MFLPALVNGTVHSEDTEESCSIGNATNFCSPWVYCDDGECKCGEIPQKNLLCNARTNLTLLDYSCITFNKEKGVFEAGNCIYTVSDKAYTVNLPYRILPRETSELNAFMCTRLFNRNGTLCGGCRDGYHPLVYSYDLNCIQCPNSKANWWKFVLVAFLPLTIFCFVVLFLNINVTSSHLYGIVFYSQVVSEAKIIRQLLLNTTGEVAVQETIRFVAMFYGIWNLDFLRSINLGICLETDSLQTLTLDLAVGIYPILLIGLTYLLIELHDRNFKPLVVIWKPFSTAFGFLRRNWKIKTSLIDAFVTFFLLTNFKFLSVSIDLLTPIKVYQLNSTGHLTYSWRLYYDATVPYFGLRHLPYAILGIAVLVAFVLLPGLLLILNTYSWFHRFLNQFPLPWYILHTIVDSVQGCFKNGTEPGTRDCRWFATVLWIIRDLLLLTEVLVVNTTFFTIATIVLVLVTILFIAVQPYKKNLSHFTYINATFALLLAFWFSGLLGVNQAKMKKPTLVLPLTWIANIAQMTPLFCVSTIILYWVYRNRRFGMEVIRKLCAWRYNGYEIVE